MEEYLQALGVGEGAPVTADMVRQLVVFFEAGSATVLSRLLAMGRVTAEELEPLMTELGDAPDDVPERLEEGPVPERFRRLALEANARGEIGLDTLARYLETDTTAAQRLADRFRLKDEEEGAPDRDSLSGEMLPGGNGEDVSEADEGLPGDDEVDA